MPKVLRLIFNTAFYKNGLKAIGVFLPTTVTVPGSSSKAWPQSPPAEPGPAREGAGTAPDSLASFD